jgi:glyoxylase-like metal-dependent hydrolase (beta-lactamase superfamily II)
MTTLEIGEATVDCVEEQRFQRPVTGLGADEAFIARYLSDLPIGFHDPATGDFDFCFQSWVIRVDGLTVLVDPCNGNGRRRPGAHAIFNDANQPYLERLEAIGVPASAVDVVFCTHLHYDHCGWNTQQVNGEWVPTFPNARYVFAEHEYARWDPSTVPAHPNDLNVSVFEESVLPIVAAGQADIVTLPHRVSPSLLIESAPGHTVGHSMLGLVSGDARAYFVGDALHHPVQVFRPSLHLRGCDDLEQAIETRRGLFTRIAAEGALIFPAHFAEPHHGRVEVGGEGFVFLAGGAPAV